jgi:gamma-glutamyltranspeptidase / glutathione hydrolase
MLLSKISSILGIFLLLLGTVIPDTALSFSAIPEKSKTGMVISAHKLADAIGMQVLEKGGNAIDAAFAVGYGLSVLHPAGSGLLGGGGFAVIYSADKKEIITLDFREMAPGRGKPEAYMNEKGEVIRDAVNTSVNLGYRAASIPGAVAGFDAMLQRFGTKKASDLLQYAISYAENGYTIGSTYEKLFKESAASFAKFESTRKYYLKPDGSPYKEGDLYVNKDLAGTLKLIGERGPDVFYKGEIADLIVKDIAANNGLVTKEDLGKFKPIWREPVRGMYRGFEIYSMPPVSSGGIAIIQMLNIMEGYNLKEMGHNSSETINVVAEAMRLAFADRAAHLGDPAFVNVPVKGLTSKKYADELRGKVQPGKATPSKEVKAGNPQVYEGNHTTYFSVVDKWGNAVAINFTIRDWFGSKACVNGAGFFLSNTLDDLAMKVGVPNEFGLVYGTANLIEPYKRPLSSMTPTMVLKDGKVFLVTGSVGGPRIINAVLQVISNVIDHGMNVREAVEAPRVHMQWIPDVLLCEPEIPRDVLTNLQKMGYAVKIRGPIPPDYFGEAHTIVIDPATGARLGAQDPRGDYTK